ncbi:MAG: hypothetical protein P1U84_17365 [Parvibaculaceae bacterium]|nr:hypothetical protein [Kordiimonadaceae bacterium]MDF1628055.1 hypothetical protein [Parvibaculaceae bacterium]|tara:strand:+ start:472 stop:657 length:186 start_codon:yes stop_codon:yes gene_type:complete
MQQKIHKQQAYRKRLIAAGRKEIQVDLPVDLIDRLANQAGNRRRGLVIEELLRKALEPHGS